MKTQRKVTVHGAEFDMTLYDTEGNSDGLFEKWSAEDDKIAQDMGTKTRFWTQHEERPEGLLETYGPSDVYMSFCYDNLVCWQGSATVKTHSRNGKHTIYLIEQFLNSYGPLTGTPLRIYQPFSETPFSFAESIEGRRTLHLITGFNQPTVGCRGMCQVFVDEIRLL